MEIRLTTRTPGAIYGENPSLLYLTNHHPASRYGMLVMCGDERYEYVDGYGPADILIPAHDNPYFGNAPDLYCGQFVYDWAAQNITTPEEEKAIRLYLQQWQEGPQLPEHDELERSQKWYTGNRLAGEISSAYDH